MMVSMTKYKNRLEAKKLTNELHKPTDLRVILLIMTQVLHEHAS